MKKYTILLGLLIFIFSATQAQTWGEWWKQTSTQKKYLLKQIAGLQIYMEFAQKGYGIARSGLTTIGQIKDGDFNLHQVFFNGHKEVNPKIKNSADAANIINTAISIRKITNQTLTSLRQTAVMPADELRYLAGVFERLNQDCGSISNETAQLLSNDMLEMTDDQRVERLQELALQMKNNLTFFKSFCNEATVLAANRKRELGEIKNSMKILGAKPQ